MLFTAHEKAHCNKSEKHFALIAPSCFGIATYLLIFFGWQYEPRWVWQWQSTRVNLGRLSNMLQKNRLRADICLVCGLIQISQSCSISLVVLRTKMKKSCSNPMLFDALGYGAQKNLAVRNEIQCPIRGSNNVHFILFLCAKVNY